MDENKEVNSTDPKREKVRVIPLSAIDDAPDHPFGVRDDEEMAELGDSVHRDSLECMRVLLAEEKAMRRRIARDTDRLLSLDCSISDEHGEEWIIDRDDFVEDIIASEIEGAFISTLTECQKSIYIHCMKPNISVREYSRLSGLALTTIQNHIEAVRKKYKKYFM